MNEFKPKYDRRSIRLREYDYTQPGAYFLTICVHDRKSAFGEIVDGQTRLNDFGQVVETEWFKTGKIRNNVKLHQHVVMPNHFHGILWITETVGATRRVAPTYIATEFTGFPHWTIQIDCHQTNSQNGFTRVQMATQLL